MNILIALVLTFVTFFVLNLFLPAGWAGILAVIVFLVYILGNNDINGRRW